MAATGRPAARREQETPVDELFLVAGIGEEEFNPWQTGVTL